MNTHTLVFWARRPTEPELRRYSHHLQQDEADELLSKPNLQEVADAVNAKYEGHWCVIAQMTLVKGVDSPEVEKATEKYDRAKSNPNRRDWWAVKP